VLNTDPLTIYLFKAPARPDSARMVTCGPGRSMPEHESPPGRGVHERSIMNEITRLEFEGKPLQFEKINEEWWATAEDVADVLGYEDRRQVLRLYKRHAEEFLPHETRELDLREAAVNLTTNFEKPAGRGKGGGNLSRVRLFSPRGLDHVGILGRTETCIRFRRWLLDISERLRTGAAVLVSRGDLDRALAAVTAEQSRALAAAAAEQALAVASVAERVTSIEKYLGEIAPAIEPEERDQAYKTAVNSAITSLAGRNQDLGLRVAAVEARLAAALEREAPAPSPVPVLAPASPAAPAHKAHRFAPVSYDAEALGRLLVTVESRFNGKAFTSRDLFARAAADDELYAALTGVMGPSPFGPLAVGHALRRLRSLPVGGRSIEPLGADRTKVQRWRVASRG